MSDQWEPVQNGDATQQESSEWEQGELGGDAISSDELADWGGGELEAAYLKALSALEASETEMPLKTADIPSPAREHAATNISARSRSSSATRPGPTSSEGLHSSVASLPLSSLTDVVPNPPPTNSPATAAENRFPAETRPTPRQIIEASLFVGGTALTSKRLCGVLRGEFAPEFVDREIDELNRLYAAESRPYEIRLGEGGYRLTLREGFERIRHKVYGLGPKEVRLSQEALEVLAVVAYHQPVKQSRVEELGKPGCGPVLRQLVRRELISVERDPAQPRDVNYKTTPRFLSLFGIRNLDELPRHEQVSYK